MFEAQRPGSSQPGGAVRDQRRAEDLGLQGQPSYVWQRRLIAMSLSSAGAIHLVLTPAHFQERTLYGLVFLTAAGSQLAVAQRLVLAPAAWVYRDPLRS